MATFTKFNAIGMALASKKHDLSADTLKLALSNTAPTAATDTEFSDITEISAGNGYSAGGYAVPGKTLTQVGAGFRLSGADTAALVAASGGSIGPFQYVVLYNDTAANKDLIAFWDLGAADTVLDGTSRDLDLSSTNDAILVIT